MWEEVDPGPIKGAHVGHLLKDLPPQRPVHGNPSDQVPGAVGLRVLQDPVLNGELQVLVIRGADIGMHRFCFKAGHHQYGEGAQHVIDGAGPAGQRKRIAPGEVTQAYADNIVGPKLFPGPESSAASDVQQQGSGVFRYPGAPWNHRSGDHFQTGSLEWSLDGRSPRLRPNAAGLLVPPGHRPHEQGALVAEGMEFAINPPVVNQTGIADGSPCDQYRYPSHHVVDHLARIQGPNRVGPALSVQLDPND